MKEACKVVQSRLCQAAPGSQIAEARRTQLKRKAAEEDAVVDVGTGVAVAAEGCPPDILQRGKVQGEAAVAAVGASDSGPSAACPCYSMKSVKPDQPMLC